jgi:hypothetical protein
MNSLRIAALVGALALAGCQTNSAVDAARITGAYAFTFYGSVYQPMLMQYAKLPTCGTPAQAPCKDPVLYKRLYELDGAVAQCAAAAQASLSSSAPDFVMINGCIQQVELAKLEFAKHGMQGVQ